MKNKEAFVREFAARLYSLVRVRPAQKRITYAAVVFDEEEIENAVEALYDTFVSSWFSIGKNGAKFEEEFARYLNMKYCVLTNSGSSANLLAVGAFVSMKLLRGGDEVLTPATTFPTTVNPLFFYGLRPVLVDVDLPSYTLSARSLDAAASSKTRGLMIPHLNGSASHMPEIMELARKRGWIVIEDCCDALGTKVDGRYAGTFSDASTFSFYGAHHLCMGEGGAVCSNNKNVIETVRSLRDWGRSTGKEVFDMKKGRKLRRVGRGSSLPEDYETRFTYVTRGFNLKPIDIQAAIGLAQLKKLGSFGERRRRNFGYLYSRLKKYERFLILPHEAWGVDPSWFVFPIVIRGNAGFSRRELVDYLEGRSIETRPILAGNITDQPAYNRRDFRIPGSLPNAKLILQKGFLIGIHPGLSRLQLHEIVSAFDSFFSTCQLAGAK